MSWIDLNADLGEGEAGDEALFAIVSSCNIACGGHTGDEASMRLSVTRAIRHGVALGAHPAYPDREGFGRRNRFLAGSALYDALESQVTTLLDIAGELGARLGHVKAHGALYNDAANDRELADILARIAVELPGDAALVGLPKSEVQKAAERAGIRFIGEAFVDRAYAPDESLVPRTQAGAVYDDVTAMASQALALATGKPVQSLTGKALVIKADTLCIHGDTPGAVVAAEAVRDALLAHGVTIRAHGGRQNAS